MTTPRPQPAQASDRKARCLRLVEHTNGIKTRPPERCTSERLPGSSLCAHHLGEAAADFRRIVQDSGGEAP